MPDNQLSFSTRVDLSGIQSGMEQVKSTVSAGAQQTASEVEDSSRRMTAAIAAYDQAARGSAATQQRLAAAFDEASSSGKGFTESMEAAVASVQKLDAAETQEIGTLTRGISARMAASAELRVLEGNIQGSTRAAAAFLTTLPGVGAALQSAFSVFGVIALTEVLFDAVRAVGRLTDAFEKLKGAETDAAIAAQDAGEKVLKIKPSFSSDTVARYLEGVPANAPVDVQNAAAALKQIQYQRQLADIAAQNNEQGKKGAELQQQKITDLQKEAGFAKDATDQAQKLIDAYTAQLTATVPFYKGVDPYAEDPHIRKITDQSQINEILKQRQAAEEAKSQFEQDQKVANAKIPGVQNRESADLDNGANKARQAQLRAMEDSLIKQKEDHQVSAVDEELYWQRYISTFSEGTTQWQTINDKYLAARAHVGAEGAKFAEDSVRDAEQERASNERISSALQENAAKIDEAANREANAQEALQRAQAQGQLQHSKMQSTIDLTSLSISTATGHTTAYSAALETARIHAQAFEDELKALGKELEAVDNNPNLSDAERGKQESDIQNRQDQLQGQKINQGLVDQNKVNQSIVQPFQTAFTTVNNDFLKVQQGMILGTESISRSFAVMGADIVASGAAWAEKWLAKQAETYLSDKVLHLLSSTQKVAQETAADSTIAATKAATATTSTATVTATNVAQALSYAAVAAAAAAAAVAGIPFVGPVLAPAAAAATYASTAGYAALAAYDVGGIIPGSGAVPIIGHGGERVLTPSQTNSFDNFVNALTSNDNSSTSNVSINQKINGGNGSSDRQFRKMLDRNAVHTARSVQRGMRSVGKV